MKKPTKRQLFTYWFDNRMANGSLGLIRHLIIASLVVALIIALLTILFGLNDRSESMPILWDTLATLINNEMPAFEDGGFGYILLMTVAALVGILFTSVLIGLITSAIEDRITQLRKGNSIVIENGHTVILGFYPGEYTLLNQLILAAGKAKACIVVADDLDRETMEQYIADNLTVPRNIRIICRTVDIIDPESVAKLSLDTCETIIISPTNDRRTIKALLAVSNIIDKSDGNTARVCAILSSEEHRFPPSVAARHNVTTFQIKMTLAKMIGHSCSQIGMSEVFTELFNFEGSELYLIRLEAAAGLSFSQLSLRLDRAVPVGLYRDGTVKLNPDADECLADGDRILVFAEDADDYVFLEEPAGSVPDMEFKEYETPDPGKILVIGFNDSLESVLVELPDDVRNVLLNVPEDDFKQIESTLSEIRPSLSVVRTRINLKKRASLLAAMREVKHVIILSDYSLSEEDSDIENIFTILQLRDLREEYQLSFNITAELQLDENRKLVASDDTTDYIVASSMSSLFLAQLSKSPELYDVFRELLSNKGNEIYIKKAGLFGCAGSYSFAELRAIALLRHCVMIGYKKHHGRCIFNPPLKGTVTLDEKDSIIVISQS